VEVPTGVVWRLGKGSFGEGWMIVSTPLAVGNPWLETTRPRRKTAFLVALSRSITGSNDAFRSTQNRL